MENGNFPPSLWGELIFMAAYLSNRSSHSALGGATSYFRMDNKEKDLSGLRAIGARAFVHRKTYTKKLDDRAFEGKLGGQSRQRSQKDLQSSQGDGRGKPQRDLFGDAGIRPAPGRHVRRLPLRGRRPPIHVRTGRTFNGRGYLRRRRLLLSHGARGKDATPAT